MVSQYNFGNSPVIILSFYLFTLEFLLVWETLCLSGLFFYLFVLLLWFLLENVLSILEVHYVRTKLLLTSGSPFLGHCFPIRTFIIWTYSLTIAFFSQMQAIANYPSAFYYVQEENIMNIAMVIHHLPKILLDHLNNHSHILLVYSLFINFQSVSCLRYKMYFYP